MKRPEVDLAVSGHEPKSASAYMLRKQLLGESITEKARQKFLVLHK